MTTIKDAIKDAESVAYAYVTGERYGYFFGSQAYQDGFDWAYDISMQRIIEQDRNEHRRVAKR